MNGPFRAARVLIADGHRATLADLRSAIEKDDGFRVCAEAADAAGAVCGAVREHPDVCVLDVRLPGGSLPATWEIGARLPDAKLVLLTESAADGDLLAAVRAGAQGYLLKTAGFANLTAALRGVLAGEAAMDARFVARLFRQLRIREPRWRRAASCGGPPGPRQPGPGPADARLTSREWEVLDLLAQGLSTAEIGRTLSISATAVRVHIAATVRKLGVPDRAAAVAMLRGPGRAARSDN